MRRLSHYQMASSFLNFTVKQVTEISRLQHLVEHYETTIRQLETDIDRLSNDNEHYQTIIAKLEAINHGLYLFILDRIDPLNPMLSTQTGEGEIRITLQREQLHWFLVGVILSLVIYICI